MVRNTNGLATALSRSAVLAAFLLCTGCGSGGDPVGTTPPTTVPPVTTAPTVVNGSVYIRSDTVAWPADGSGVPGLSNVPVTLGSTTANTASSGGFSLQAVIAATPDAIPVTATAPGYMTAWSPWRVVDATQPIAIGVYPERTVSPRASGFLKGVSLHDASAWGVDWFNSGLTGPTIARMRNTVGANVVVFPDMLSLTQMDTATNTAVITNESFGLGVRAHYETMVAQARSNGMAFMMVLSIQPRGAALTPFSTIFQVPATKTAFWTVFFAAYRARVLEKAAIARDLGIEYLAVGFNESYLSRLDVSLWQNLVRDVRAIGYTGKVVYVAGIGMPNNFYELASAPAGFPALFDLFGFTFSAGVTGGRGEVLANAQPRTRMRTDLRAAFDRMNQFLAASGRNYFLVASFPSVFGAAVVREFIEPCLSCSQVAASYTRDYMAQADLYQALAEVINERPGDARIAGVVTWGYLWHDDYSRAGNFSAANSAAFDKSANVRDKPAEAVLKWWFQRW
jgi:hypothetical protein